MCLPWAGAPLIDSACPELPPSFQSAAAMLNSSLSYISWAGVRWEMGESRSSLETPAATRTGAATSKADSSLGPASQSSP